MKSRTMNAASIIMSAILSWSQAQWNIMSAARSFERHARKTKNRNGLTRKELLERAPYNPLRGYYNRYSNVMTEMKVHTTRRFAFSETKN